MVFQGHPAPELQSQEDSNPAPPLENPTFTSHTHLHPRLGHTGTQIAGPTLGFPESPIHLAIKRYFPTLGAQERRGHPVDWVL